jgi:hypothetical protein
MRVASFVQPSAPECPPDRGQQISARHARFSGRQRAPFSEKSSFPSSSKRHRAQGVETIRGDKPKLSAVRLVSKLPLKILRWGQKSNYEIPLAGGNMA